jgi:hypothetical protein
MIRRDAPSDDRIVRATASFTDTDAGAGRRKRHGIADDRLLDGG